MNPVHSLTSAMPLVSLMVSWNSVTNDVSYPDITKINDVLSWSPAVNLIEGPTSSNIHD